MKKVRIITFQDVTNYGAVLQAYALCKVVESFGFDAKIINYKLHHTKCKASRAEIIKKGREKFEEFKKTYLPMTGLYNSPEELDKIDADYLICGSDQVWNFNLGPEVRNNSKVLFLQFGNSNAKRISYAASTGGSAIPAEYQAEIKNALEKFDAISVREPDSASSIAKLANKPIKVTLDPTLIYDDYPTRMPQDYKVPKKYIALYLMQKNQIVYDVVRKIKKAYKLPIINLKAGFMPLADKIMEALSPPEWLYMLKNAEFVITNSFHGTVFAIKFERKFCCIPMLNNNSRRKYLMEDMLNVFKLQNIFSVYPRRVDFEKIKADYSGRNSRLKNVLANCGLIDRYCDKDMDIEKFFEKPDYEIVKKNLSGSVKGSLNFLKEALAE